MFTFKLIVLLVIVPVVQRKADAFPIFEKIEAITENGTYKDWEQEMSTLLASESLAQMLASVQMFDDIVAHTCSLQAALDIGACEHDFGKTLERLRLNMGVCNLAQKFHAKPGPHQTRTSMISAAMKQLPKMAIPDGLRHAANKILGKA